VIALALAALTFGSGLLVEPPCDGCAASVPSADAGPAPLLVVLHGDYGLTAPQIERAWAKHASPRGVAVLAIACPRALGCQGSFWKWNGDPAWIVAQVDALARNQPIDRRRLWLAGWSGGATYIGMHTQFFERTFAALVHHGGGMAPSSSACADAPAPVYFLVGDKNPLHEHTRWLRDHYASCANAVTWDLLPGADHTAEWRALDAHAPAIFDWLADKRLAPEPPSPPPVESMQSTPMQPARIAAPVPRGCGCSHAWLVALLALAKRMRVRTGKSSGHGSIQSSSAAEPSCDAGIP
jgi:dienelactone hydrolase